MRAVCLIVICVFMFFACGACTTAPVKPDRSAIDSLKDPVSELHRWKLDNGLELVVIPRKVVPLVTILAAVKNGAMAESDEYDGLSHLYEHMFFKGNSELPNQEAYMKRMRELGMSFNGTTSTEAVRYFFTLPKENLLPGLSFMRAALVSPSFEQGELTREISTVLAEYDRNESNPVFHLQQAMTKAMYPMFISRKNVIGEREVIKTATREKMLTISSRYYVPNNTLLVVSGDVEPDEVRQTVEKLYLSWPKADDPYDLWPVPRHPPLKESQTITVEQPFQNVLINFGWHGPSVDQDQKATYAADVFSTILGQESSAFNKKLVDSGLLLVAGLSYYTQRYVGPIYFQGMASPDKAAQAIEAMNEVVAKLDEYTAFTDEELENAKLMLAAGALYDWQHGLSVANNLGFWWCVADIDYRLNYIDNLKKVSREDIRRFIAKYIAGKHYILGVMASKRNMVKTGLAGASTVEKEVAQ